MSVARCAPSLVICGHSGYQPNTLQELWLKACQASPLVKHLGQLDISWNEVGRTRTPQSPVFFCVWPGSKDLCGWLSELLERVIFCFIKTASLWNALTNHFWSWASFPNSCSDLKYLCALNMKLGYTCVWWGIASLMWIWTCGGKELDFNLRGGKILGWTIVL